MNTSPLYTLCCVRIDMNRFIQILKTFNINCVVDLRVEARSMYDPVFTANNMQEALNCNNIYYLPFGTHFDTFGSEEKDRYGRLIYNKVIQTSQFLEGIERIYNGVSKGYRIVLVDSAFDIEKSPRFSIVGQYFNDKGFIVQHINDMGRAISHKEMTDIIQTGKMAQKRKREQAKQLGVNGEELAALYLINNGYRILDRNWNLYKGCELDIVAMKDNVLHFVEVKTRSNTNRGEPQEAIDRKKMKHIISAIKEYRWKEYITDKPYVIDSIAIVYRSESDYDLKHTENISYTFKKFY